MWCYYFSSRKSSGWTTIQKKKREHRVTYSRKCRRPRTTSSRLPGIIVCTFSVRGGEREEKSGASEWIHRVLQRGNPRSFWPVFIPVSILSILRQQVVDLNPRVYFRVYTHRIKKKKKNRNISTYMHNKLIIYKITHDDTKRGVIQLSVWSS